MGIWAGAVMGKTPIHAQKVVLTTIRSTINQPTRRVVELPARKTSSRTKLLSTVYLSKIISQSGRKKINQIGEFKTAIGRGSDARTAHKRINISVERLNLE